MPDLRTKRVFNWFSWSTVFVVAVASWQELRAGSVSTKAFPNRPALRVTYSPDPASDRPFGVMTIEVDTGGVACPADRHIEAILYVAPYGQSSVAYRTGITIPQGATSVQAELPYTQPTDYVYWLFDVLEEGRSIATPKPHASYSSQTTNRATAAYNGCEIYDGDLTDAPRFPQNFSADGVVCQPYRLSEAPTDWRWYLNFGFVIWPVELLSKASEAQRESLSAYGLSGGNVVISFVSDQVGQVEVSAVELGEIDQWLSQSTREGEPDARWKPLRDAAGNAYGFIRRHGGGSVIMLTHRYHNLHADALRGTTHYPITTVTRSGPTNERWFWRNLIETVGKTPVWAFTAFVLLFVLLVGPGLLYFTSRLRQRTLMLLLVPALSTLLTSCILFYNVVREGTTTRGRIASLQYFEVPAGQGFAWSRQTYFSGFPPREGLSFSAQTFLKPIDMGEASYSSWNDPSRNVFAEIAHDGQSQKLRRWLLSRSQQQLVVGHPLDQFHLPIQVEALDGQLRITNISQSTLPIVILRGAHDEFYWLSQVPPNGSALASPQLAADVKIAYANESKAWIPEIPPEIDITRSRRRYQSYYGYTNPIDRDPLETVLQSPTVIDDLPKYGFFIFATESADVETPFPESVYQQERHLHVLTGVSPW